jgi:hypothetical protein
MSAGAIPAAPSAAKRIAVERPIPEAIDGLLAVNARGGGGNNRHR